MNSVTKSAFRKDCLNRLKNCAKQGKLKKDKSIENKIYKIIKQNSVKNILLYIPLAMEVNTKGLIHRLKREKKYNIFVPFMVGETLKIVPFRYPLIKKRFGILEPKNSNIGKRFKIDLAIVPVVGTDISLRRVGFGVGFYDRFFESLSYTPKIVFTQLCLCKSGTILTEPHDIKGDYIVTHKGLK